MTRVAFVDGESSAAGMPPQLQHRICGALSAAGFDSTGRKIRSGDYKGVTAFARVQREPDYPPPTLAKRGERHGGASLIWALFAPSSLAMERIKP
jgi:hypothetical protein